MSNFDLLAICLTVIILACIIAAVAFQHLDVLAERSESASAQATVMLERDRMDAADRCERERLEVARVQEDARQAQEAHMAPTRVGERVTVHTKLPDDQTIHGVLVGDYPDRLVLAHGEYVDSSGTTPIPGAHHDIDTRSIAWIDVHQLVTEGDLVATEANTKREG